MPPPCTHSGGIYRAFWGLLESPKGKDYGMTRTRTVVANPEEIRHYEREGYSVRQVTPYKTSTYSNGETDVELFLVVLEREDG